MHFHRESRQQIRTVVGFIAEGLSNGHPVIAVTELARSDEFLAALAQAGHSPDGTTFQLYDAAETLGRIAPDGAPDRLLFEAHVGKLVRASAAYGVEPYVYGDMVGVLWAAGNVRWAIELEELWNELADEVPFELCCGYPSSDTPVTHRAFSTVCDLHTVVTGAAPLPHGDVTRRFPESYTSAAQARRFVAEMLEVWGLDAVAGDARLVVSELVTNAVGHGCSDVAVALTRADGAVRIAVGDAEPRPPVVRDPDPEVPGGRGMVLVAALASRWGCEAVEGGKVVWADLPVGPGGQPESQPEVQR